MENKTICINCMQEFDGSIDLVCPHCGFYQNTPKREAYFLDPGTMLKERFVIGNVIGNGGFGITYVAFDTVLNKKVAIKEYFPTSFATRMAGTTELCVHDSDYLVQFNEGKKKFVDEAMFIAKFNQTPNIVHVLDCFLYNSTAYIVMEYVGGKNLKETLQDNGPLPYQEVVRYAIPVLYALDRIHKEGIIHRDIAPDNIKVDGDKVVLLDFGAARNATLSERKGLSVILKPGYAPQEQYLTHGEQGPWTDIYAVGAVMYHLITGKVPQESIERAANDELKTPTELGFNIPENVENAIMNALNREPKYRVQSAKEFADALSGLVVLEKNTNPAPNKKPEAIISKRSKIIIAALSVVAAALILFILASSNSITDSSNRNGVNVPNLVNMDTDEALKKLDELGIEYQIDGVLELEDIDEGDSDRIAYQSIEPNSAVAENEILILKIAKAPVVRAVVPNLTALNEKEAAKALKKAGFKNFKFKKKADSRFNNGLVCGQSVKPKEKVPLNTQITVYISDNKSKTAKKDKTAAEEESTEEELTNTSTDEETSKAETKAQTTTQRETTTKAETTTKKLTTITTKKNTTTKKPTTTKKETTTKIQTTVLETTTTAEYEIEGREADENE